MSLRDRELIIEYIRMVRDHQIMLERMAKYIDTANSRATDVVTAYLNGRDIEGEHAATSNGSASSNRVNRVISRRSSILTTTSSNLPRRPTTVPPPPPSEPAPPPPPPETAPPPPPPEPAPITTSNRVSAESDDNVSTNTTESPSVTTSYSLITADSSNNILPRTHIFNPNDRTLIRVRRWTNNTMPTTTSVNIPNGRATIRRRRNGLPGNIRFPSRSITRPPYALDFPEDGETMPRDIGSPVRVRPSTSQIRNSTELLKWEDISGNYQEVCPISMLEFKEGDDILRIKSCQHIFREMNLRQWFRYSSRCPICRYDIRDWVG